MDAEIWGFLGVITGAAASILTTVQASKNTVRLQRDANDQDRKERAQAFQRETLLAVQKALYDSFCLMMEVHRADLKANQNGGGWGQNSINKEINDNNIASLIHLLMLTERVADDSLRDELKKVQIDMGSASMAATREGAESLVASVIIQTDTIMARLGTLLRKLY